MSYSWGAGQGIGPVVGTAVRQPVDVVADTRSHLAAVPAAVSAAVPAEPGPATVAHGLDLRRLAAELAPMVQVWQRLMVEHVPDRSGRCRTCTKGGTGLPSTPWPCSIYGIADLARRRHGEC